MKEGTVVVYIDHSGENHNALVISENPVNPGFLTLAAIADGEVKIYSDVHTDMVPGRGSYVDPSTSLAALPSAADLDAVAAEQKAAEATSAEPAPTDVDVPTEPDVTKLLDAAGPAPEETEAAQTQSDGEHTD